VKKKEGKGDALGIRFAHFYMSQVTLPPKEPLLPSWLTDRRKKNKNTHVINRGKNVKQGGERGSN